MIWIIGFCILAILFMAIEFRTHNPSQDHPFLENFAIWAQCVCWWMIGFNIGRLYF